MRYRRRNPNPHNEILRVCKGVFSSDEHESSLHLQFPLSSIPSHCPFQTLFFFYESIAHLMYNDDETQFLLAAGELAESLVNKRTKEYSLLLLRRTDIHTNTNKKMSLIFSLPLFLVFSFHFYR